MLTRRNLLKSAIATPLATTLAMRAAPAIAAGQSRVLRFVPDGDLQSPDPIWSTSSVVRTHGYMIYDTLYALDRKLTPQPQMVAGHELSSDGLTWRFKLRDGLRFHDGEPVRAKDCVASLNRWMQRDPLGQQIVLRLNELSAEDDVHFTFRLKRPFPLLISTLAKSTVYVPFMMPERIAATPSTKAITEYVGSGPFRFLPLEWVPGARAVYSRFDGYVPRDEAPSYVAGGKKVNVDRVEWNILPDAATAAAAIQTGEQDWWMTPQADLIDMLKASKGVSVELFDFVGLTTLMRFNSLQAPFNNQKLRQALLPAIDQTQFMQAVFGDQTDAYKTPLGTFSIGSPYAVTDGLDVLAGPRSIDKAKDLVKQSGYKGEEVVLMAATNYPVLNALSLVARDVLTKVGLNVTYVATDWGSVVQRRAKKEPVQQGGWSAFCTFYGADSMNDPTGHLPLVGSGEKGWFGWPTSSRIEELRAAWYDAADLAKQKSIARDLQLAALDEVPYIPLGQYFSPTAVRKEFTGLVKGPIPVFWGVEKRG